MSCSGGASALQEELARVRQVRQQHREQRTGVPTVALVGYTNAGKSSLLGRLVNKDMGAEDRLFATLDPVFRRVRLPSGTSFLVTRWGSSRTSHTPW